MHRLLYILTCVTQSGDKHDANLYTPARDYAKLYCTLSSLNLPGSLVSNMWYIEVALWDVTKVDPPPFQVHTNFESFATAPH